MQIIYSKTVGHHHFSEKRFYLSPGECVLIVMEKEEVIKAMKKRSSFNTRACFNKIVLVLVKSSYMDSIFAVPKNANLEEFLVECDVVYDVKSVSLKDFVNCEFISHEQLIYAFFKQNL